MKDPRVAQPWRCPFCGASFEAWLLDPSAREAVERLDERLDSPCYDTSCNYLLLDVKVCPDCGFATNDPAPVEADDASRRRLLATQPARMTLVRRAPTVSSRERTAADAIAAYRIAIQCAAILGKGAAEYAIRAARLCEESGRLDERRTLLEVAVGFLRKAPPSPRAIYQLGALSIVLGDGAGASKALEQLRTLDAGYHGRLRRQLKSP